VDRPSLEMAGSIDQMTWSLASALALHWQSGKSVFKEEDRQDSLALPEGLMSKSCPP
jgi:hypothetical protein